MKGKPMGAAPDSYQFIVTVRAPSADLAEHALAYRLSNDGPIEDGDGGYFDPDFDGYPFVALTAPASEAANVAVLCCQACGDECVPIDALCGWVGVDDDAVVGDPNGNPTDIVYTPTGHTDIDWDAATTVGYGCRCGHRRIDAATVLAPFGLCP